MLFIAAYSSGIAVEAASGITVSHRVITNEADFGGLVALSDAAHQALGRAPVKVFADTAD